MAPVRFAMARWDRDGSLPASHAMTASTANSGSVCSHASSASASPWEMRNCAASAPQATRNADSSIDGKVQRAETAPPAALACALRYNRIGLTAPPWRAKLTAHFDRNNRGAMGPQVIVTRRTHFNAAHRLHTPALNDAENTRVFGPCANPNFHG